MGRRHPFADHTKETTMLVRSVRALRQTRPANGLRRQPCRLCIETLEDRSVPSTVTLSPNDDSPLVGERITWTASAVDCGSAPVYQFSAAPHGGEFHVVRDFSPINMFT